MTDMASESSGPADLDAVIDDEMTATDVKTLSAFGYETRYRLVRLLVEAEGGVNFDEITPYVSVSDSAVSHALSTLTDAGLVTKRKDGRWRKYRATKRATALLTVLDGSR